MTTVIAAIIGSSPPWAWCGPAAPSPHGAATAGRAPRSTPTFLFADLVGYTMLTEVQGNEHAARVAREFQRSMSALSRGHGARHVKSMGDGVMIWAPDPDTAVALAEQVLNEVGTRGDLLPVRVGVHTGPAVELDGDWYGSAVNIASRLSDAARPNEALVSAATSAAVSCELRRLGLRRELVLQGVVAPHPGVRARTRRLLNQEKRRTPTDVSSSKLLVAALAAAAAHSPPRPRQRHWPRTPPRSSRARRTCSACLRPRGRLERGRRP